MGLVDQVASSLVGQLVGGRFRVICSIAALPQAVTEAEYTFDSSNEGWTTEGPQVFQAPSFGYDPSAGRLNITAVPSGSRFEFGYWGSPETGTLVHPVDGRLYFAEFTVESGQKVTADLLQAAPKLDAVWNHDDDQGIGVLAAIEQAGRKEFFMVGGAGSRNAMDLIKADTGVLKCTVTYPPTMAASAVNLARLVAQGNGMGDLVENEIPASITLASATVTKDNVDKYLPLGFAS
mgnify:CR=1 FL=1